ncbi:unannotated protein [freshwater metagenome]|uniref:Unannotated protein n=1 Tax=freshwater metagenome TaxID=449393 RepID=A0A6J7F2P0_9ZZZZ|nr:hypothetical protein [Actinomycetota bacterium]
MTNDSLNPEREPSRAELEALRDALRLVEVPVVAREAAITTALATFDEMPDVSPAQTAPSLGTVVSMIDRRRRHYHWLAGATATAAAAVVVLVIGAAVLNNGSNDNMSSGSVDAVAKDVPARSAAGTEAAMATANSTPTADASGVAGGINGPAAVTPWATAPNLTTNGELIAYAADPSFGSGASTDPANYNTSCLTGTTGLFAAVIYQGQQVIAVRDDVAAMVRIIDPQSCRVITTVSLG